MEVLADAAGKLSKEAREAHPEIEWDAITGFATASPTAT